MKKVFLFVALTKVCSIAYGAEGKKALPLNNETTFKIRFLNPGSIAKQGEEGLSIKKEVEQAGHKFIFGRSTKILTQNNDSEFSLIRHFLPALRSAVEGDPQNAIKNMDKAYEEAGNLELSSISAEKLEAHQVVALFLDHLASCWPKEYRNHRRELFYAKLNRIIGLVEKSRKQGCEKQARSFERIAESFKGEKKGFLRYVPGWNEGSLEDRLANWKEIDEMKVIGEFLNYRRESLEKKGFDLKKLQRIFQ